MHSLIHLLVVVLIVPELNAEQMMLAAHPSGKACVKTLPAMAMTSRLKASPAARLSGHPLAFPMMEAA